MAWSGYLKADQTEKEVCFSAQRRNTFLYIGSYNMLHTHYLHTLVEHQRIRTNLTVSKVSDMTL